jgi:hypothetical protein
VSFGALRCAHLLPARIVTASYARKRAEEVGDSHDDVDAGYRAGAILNWQLRFARALNGAAAGLPCSDEQKKTRLRSHLSA